MLFTADQVVRLSERELLAFLDRAIPEATGYIDYKAKIDTEKPERATAELLKDVSGFANADGGDLLVGVQEPIEENAGGKFLLGIGEGAAYATALEQKCSAGIDPRIPGLRVVPIALSNGNSVVVVHVPPSPNRPHMVIHAPTGTRTFFVRHSETTMPMTTAEIRHAVLSSVTTQQEVRAYVEAQESRILRSFQPHGSCVLALHAVPLVPVEVEWDVTDDTWRPVMFGNNRPDRQVKIKTNHNRRPTVEGVAGTWSVDGVLMQLFEIHRLGYIGAAMLIEVDSQQRPPAAALYESHLDFLDSFGDLCNEALATAKSDRPYLLQLRMANAGGSTFEYGGRYVKISPPLQRQEIRAQELRRESGQDFVESMNPWKRTIWNAYGLDYKPQK